MKVEEKLRAVSSWGVGKGGLDQYTGPALRGTGLGGADPSTLNCIEIQRVLLQVYSPAGQ
jgi:hypothetical protein